MPLKTTPDIVHVVRQTLDDVAGMFIADPENMQGCLVYVADEDMYYKLVLHSNLLVNPPLVLASTLGGDSRWVQTNIAATETPEPTMADYVIVGLGTAGCALARYLSEDMTTSVVVLEAGENRETDPKIFDGVGFGAPDLSYNPRFSFTRTTDPADIHISEAGVYGYSDGRVWGGSSAHNGMVAFRGTTNDYAKWAVIDPQWSYANLLPVFKWLETYTPDGTPLNPAERGTTGPRYITQDVPFPPNAAPPAAINHLYDDMASASNSTIIDDYNDAATPCGVTQSQWFKSNAAGTAGGLERRSWVQTAFLPNSVLTPAGQGVGDRKLEVISKATAVELIIEETVNGPTATGVRYFLPDEPDQILEISATTKVILCAGAIGNAQLLQLSGVGPAALLAQHDIPLKLANDNVGKHMQNHYGPYTCMGQDPANPIFDPPANPFAVYYALVDESGSDPGAMFGRSGYNLPQANDNIRRTQIYQIPGAGFIPPSLVTALDIPTGLTDSISLLTFLVTDTEPNGTVEIISNDPNANPEVKWNFYKTTPEVPVPSNDLERAVNLYKLMANISQQYSITAGVDMPILYPPLAHFPAPYGPAPDDALLESDAKNVTLIAAFHACGTCRMSADASTGVVDGDLNVHGVNNLSCCDNSAVPAIISGNTDYSAMVLGLMKAKIEGATVPF